MPAPLISVILPSYNQAAFLERTLISICSQPKDLFELIVIDGGSTDSSIDIIHKYASFITYWQSKPDEGQADALQIGLARARGQYVGWQNSDDRYLPDAFQKIANAISAIESSKLPDVFFGHCEIIDQDDQIISKNYFVPFSANAFRYAGWNITNQSSFYKRETLERIGGFDKTFQYAMDGDLIYRLINSQARFLFINEFLGQFRIHSEAKGTQLKNVGREEWSKLRLREEEQFNPHIPWEKQVKFHRWLYLSRRHLWLVLGGNWLRWFKDNGKLHLFKRR